MTFNLRIHSESMKDSYVRGDMYVYIKSETKGLILERNIGRQSPENLRESTYRIDVRKRIPFLPYTY